MTEKMPPKIENLLILDFQPPILTRIGDIIQVCRTQCLRVSTFLLVLGTLFDG